MNTKGNPRAVVDPGPQNPTLTGQFPNAFTPPAIDVRDLPLFWASFNNAPPRIQDGGWARQVTQSDFQIAESIAGVNMRLAAGGVRELHWHQAAEWAFLSYGNCRVTVLDPRGRVHTCLRQWQAVGVQYAIGDRLDRPHAAGRSGGELWRARRNVQHIAKFAQNGPVVLPV